MPLDRDGALVATPGAVIPGAAEATPACNNMPAGRVRDAFTGGQRCSSEQPAHAETAAYRPERWPGTETALLIHLVAGCPTRWTRDEALEEAG